MSSGLQPHPLIVGLATRLVREKKPSATKRDLKAVVSEVRGGTPEDPEAAANEFASTPQLPELTIFIGFVGGTIERDGKTWRLLYQDPKALTWLLVRGRRDRLVRHRRGQIVPLPASRCALGEEGIDCRPGSWS